MANWPTQTILPLKVELLINGVWTDISTYVYTRDSIVIQAGSSDKSSKPNPAQCQLTLNNRDGRFTPGSSGALAAWGGNYLVRNTQIRVSVNGVSSVTANTYTGFRFWGTVPDWPPTSDISGNDVYVQITASGPLRQI